MIPPVAKFDKSNPVNKTHLWRCFKQTAVGFARVPVAVAHSIIGLNAPKYLIKNDYAVRENGRAGDFYRLTPLGQQWLIDGIKRYTVNHPEALNEVEFHPDKPVAQRRIVRRR